MEWFCPGCWGEGEIVHRDSKRPVVVVCTRCSYIDAYVWCEHCGMGGQIASTDFNQRPLVWTCRECGNSYRLPPDVYQHMLEFHPAATASSPPLWMPLEKRMAHISPPWLRGFVLFWEKHRLAFYLGAIGAFGVLTLFAVLNEKTALLAHRSWKFLADLLLVICIGGLFLAWVLDFLTWIIQKYFTWQRKRQHPGKATPYRG